MSDNYIRDQVVKLRAMQDEIDLRVYRPGRWTEHVAVPMVIGVGVAAMALYVLGYII